ncbi:MAG: paraquat-inducible protein A [Candidatus Omnitrophica bacterium]|nr:paraquat-inducible protein A [Candidatus Omnitrophota bacterium]
MSKNKKSLKEFYPGRNEILLLLLLCFILLITGLSLPIVTVEKKILWQSVQNTYSVASGIVDLAKQGDYVLATVVFFFSMIFPFAKLLSLLVIWLVKLSFEERMRVLHWLGILGKWSMLDVFAVAILVVLAKLRTLTTVEPRVGIYFFGSSILFSMITTMTIDLLARKHARS